MDCQSFCLLLELKVSRMVCKDCKNFKQSPSYPNVGECQYNPPVISTSFISSREYPHVSGEVDGCITGFILKGDRGIAADQQSLDIE